MLFRSLRLPTLGRLLRSSFAARVVDCWVWTGDSSSQVVLLTNIGRNGSKCWSSSGSHAGEQSSNRDSSWMRNGPVDNEDQHVDSSKIDYTPWWNSSGKDHREEPAAPLGPLSFFDLLSQSLSDLTSRRLRGLAAALFPDTKRKSQVRRYLLPNIQQISHDLATRRVIGLTTQDVLDLPKQLLSAAILSNYTNRPLASQRDWAHGLFTIALERYRSLDTDAHLQDVNFYSVWYKQYVGLLDLLQLWNVFFQVHRPAQQRQQFPLRAAIDHAANRMPPNSSYQDRLLAFAPTWVLNSDPQSDQQIVFSSFITLTILVKIRHRLLSCVGASMSGGMAAAEGSFLNIRNVSPPEAIFMRIVGRAAQSAPPNQIYLRLGLSQLGFTSIESQNLGRTVGYIHNNPDYLLMEAERCISTIEATTEPNDSANGNAGHGERPEPVRDLRMERESQFFHRNRSMTPTAVLSWIGQAESDELRVFRDCFLVATKDSIVEPGSIVLDAIIERTLALAQRPSSENDGFDDIIQILTPWFAISASDPSQTLMQKVLAHFRGMNNTAGFLHVWAVLQTYRTVEKDLDALKGWLSHLWSKNMYRQAMELHKQAVTVICGLERRNRWLVASALTNECLSLCGQGRSNLAKARYFFRTYRNAGFRPDRHMCRLRMRLCLAADDMRGFVSVFRRYNTLPGEFEALDEESWLLLESRWRILVSHMRIPVILIFQVVWRAVRTWHGDVSQARYYFQETQRFAPSDAWEGLIKAHSYLLMKVCDSMDLPNKLKLAGCIHKHLFQCVPVGHLPTFLASEVAKMEKRIALEFWRASNAEQLRFLCRHLAARVPETLSTALPVVKSQKLVTKWLVARLKWKHLRYDLGTRVFSNLGSHLRYLLQLPEASANAKESGREMMAVNSSGRQRVQPWEQRVQHEALELFRFHFNEVHSVEKELFAYQHGSDPVTSPLRSSQRRLKSHFVSLYLPRGPSTADQARIRPVLRGSRNETSTGLRRTKRPRAVRARSMIPAPSPSPIPSSAGRSPGNLSHVSVTPMKG